MFNNDPPLLSLADININTSRARRWIFQLFDYNDEQYEIITGTLRVMHQEGFVVYACVGRKYIKSLRRVCLEGMFSTESRKYGKFFECIWGFAPRMDLPKGNLEVLRSVILVDDAEFMELGRLPIDKYPSPS